MKIIIKPFPFVLAILMAALVAFFIYSLAEGVKNDVLFGICAFVCFGATLVPAMGLQFTSRASVNVRVLSGLFLLGFFVVQLFFAWLDASVRYYVIINGLLLLIYLGVLYKVLQAD